MQLISILVLGGALAAAPALIFGGKAPPDYPHDLTAPFPRNMGPNGSQFQRYNNGSLSSSAMGSNAGSFDSMCGLDSRLDLTLNFTGARPAGKECDCDFRAQAAEINGYPSQLNAQSTPPQTTTRRAESRPSQLAAAQGSANRTENRGRCRVSARRHTRARHRVQSAGLHHGTQETTGAANRSAPPAPAHPTPVEWIMLGALCGIGVGGAGLALRRLRGPHR